MECTDMEQHPIARCFGACVLGMVKCSYLLGLVYLLYSIVLHLQHYAQHGLGDSLAVPFFFAISSFAACACAAACARARLGSLKYAPDHIMLPQCCFRACIIWTFLGFGLFWGTLAISTGISFPLECKTLLNFFHLFVVSMKE